MLGDMMLGVKCTHPFTYHISTYSLKSLVYFVPCLRKASPFLQLGLQHAVHGSETQKTGGSVLKLLLILINLRVSFLYSLVSCLDIHCLMHPAFCSAFFASCA